MEYSGLIFHLASGGYAVEFPDIPEAFGEGASLEECLATAAEVLAIAVEEYQAARKPLPKPSSAEIIWRAAATSDLQQYRKPDEAIMLLRQRVPNPETQPVKVNISLTKGELADIDAKAKSLGMSRSGLFVKGALAYAD